jgi:phosphoglycerate dehydrogenase-like enzyme
MTPPPECRKILFMNNCTVVVLADPGDPQLDLMNSVCQQTRVVIGNYIDVFDEAASEARIILNWSGTLSLFRHAFSRCRNVQWVHTRSAGLERTLTPELIGSPVTLTNGTGTFSASLGEFALAAILYFAKNLRRMIRNQAMNAWQPFDVLPIAGHTVGIVGYGDIGRAVALRVRPLGMKVLAVKRHVPASPIADDLVEEIYGPDRIPQMLSRCDYIVVAAPLTPETQGMIGESELAAMKSTAVLINVGRGPVISERALVSALSRGSIKGAALDVFDEEPLPTGHPFYSLENVLLSPHCADHTPDWLDQAMRFFVDQFGRFQRGEPLLNIVDKKLGY